MANNICLKLYAVTLRRSKNDEGNTRSIVATDSKTAIRLAVRAHRQEFKIPTNVALHAEVEEKVPVKV